MTLPVVKEVGATGVRMMSGLAIDGSAEGLSRKTTHSSSAASKSVGMSNDLSVGLDLISSLTKSLLKANDKYEQSNRILEAGSGETGDELNKLKQIHRSIMNEVPNDRIEVSKVMIDVISNTKAKGDELKDLTIYLLKAASTNNKIDLELSSALTGAMKSNNIGASRGIEVVDKAFAISQEKYLEMDVLGREMIQVGPKLHLLDIDIDDSLDLLGTWYNNKKDFKTLESGLSILFGNMQKARVTNYAEAFQDLITKIKEAPTVEEASQLATVGLSTQIGHVLTSSEQEVVTDWVLAARSGWFDKKEVNKPDYLRNSKGLVGRTYKKTFYEKVNTLENQISNILGSGTNQLISYFFSSKDEQKKNNKPYPLFNEQNKLIGSGINYNKSTSTTNSNSTQKIPNLLTPQKQASLDTLMKSLNLIKEPLQKNDQVIPNTWPDPDTSILLSKDFQSRLIMELTDSIDSPLKDLKPEIQNSQDNPVELPTKMAGSTLFTNNTLNYMQAPMENPAYGPPGYPMPPAGYNNYPGAISNPANIEVNPVINVTVNGDSYESTAKDIAERIKEVIQEVFESASRRQGIAGV